MRNPLRKLPSLIDWLRAGYPDEAPHTGYSYSPLIALNGPSTLSEKQTREIAGELGSDPCDNTDIGVAITRATGRLPIASQVRKVAEATRNGGNRGSLIRWR